MKLSLGNPIVLFVFPLKNSCGYQMGINPMLLPSFLGGNSSDSSFQAKPVPNSCLVVPRVSLFGRPSSSSVAPGNSTGNAASLREGMAGVMAWAASSAN